MKQAGEWDSG